MSPQPPIHAPPQPLTASGQPRRVGLELELAGLSIDEITRLVADLYGGQPVTVNHFQRRVTGTRLGDFTVEVDSVLLTGERYVELLEGLGLRVRGQPVQRLIDEVVETVAATLVPYEIVLPPVPYTELHALERLREELRARRAEGTRASLRYAFGLHLNPEAARLDARSVLAHLRAFFLLYDWILVEGQIDLARRLAPFIGDFPESYRRRVLEPTYDPALGALIEDYLADNPTRNRPLDLLPLLAHLSPEQVRGRVEEPELLKPRPAYHYRLPNSMVDEPDWSFTAEWNRWVVIERLAADSERVARMARAYLSLAHSSPLGHREDWASQVPAWLDRLG